MEFDFGGTLSAIRKMKMLTQDDLANALDYSRATIVNIEKNRHNVNQKVIFKICQFLDIDPNILFGFKSTVTVTDLRKLKKEEIVLYKIEKQLDKLEKLKLELLGVSKG